MHPNSIVTPTPSPSAAPPGEVGFAQTDVGQYITQNSGHSNGWGDGPSGLQIQINGAGFAGSNGALSIFADTPPAWLISGGTQVDTLTGTATIGFGGFSHFGNSWHDNAVRKPLCSGAMSSLSLTLTDSANGLTVTLTSNSRGQLSGTVKQTSTGQTVATMTLDFTGWEPSRTPAAPSSSAERVFID